jgi:hypothetical protein
MADLDITQAEADALIAMEKHRAGHGDKWAIPAPVDRYPNVQDLFSTFEAFMRQCNITDVPRIEKGLFS